MSWIRRSIGNVRIGHLFKRFRDFPLFSRKCLDKYWRSGFYVGECLKEKTFENDLVVAEWMQQQRYVENWNRLLHLFWNDFMLALQFLTFLDFGRGLSKMTSRKMIKKLMAQTHWHRGLHCHHHIISGMTLCWEVQVNINDISILVLGQPSDSTRMNLVHQYCI